MTVVIDCCWFVWCASADIRYVHQISITWYTSTLLSSW